MYSSFRCAVADFLSDDASMHVRVESIITKTEDSPTKTRDLPPGLQARIVSMPKRLPPERAEKMIVDLCAWKPLSAEELAGILGKTTNYLSNKYLSFNVKWLQLRIGSDL